MGRPVILSNGSLAVGLDANGLVHDFYYPYVGLDNFTTARSVHHKIGVWVDGRFSWTDDGSWDIHVDFEADALVSTIRMQSNNLEVELLFRDFVDFEYNAFCRQIHVTNQSSSKREIRVFTHQVFQISRGGRADTALFVPEESYILDYKGHSSLLVYGQDRDGQIFDQFAIGNYGIEGKEGTFRDAEDGELSGSPVEHGGVDSVLRFRLEVDAHAHNDIDYWIVAAESQYDAEKVHLKLKGDGFNERLRATRKFWHTWIATAANIIHTLDKSQATITKKSLMIIKAHCDARGGVIASTDSSIYNYGRDYYTYVWPRDGAYAMWPLIRMGYTEEPKKFFEFCRDTLAPEGYLRHKYQPDRALGSTWHPMLHKSGKELPIQEDETAIVLYMLGEYLAYSHDEAFVQGLYDTLIKPAADFMASFIDDSTGLPHASYDLWEQKFLTSTYTVATVYQSLLVAADFAEQFGYPDDAVSWTRVANQLLTNSSVFFDADRGAFRKGYLKQSDGSLQFDNTLDISSMYGALTFGYHNLSNELQRTVELIEKQLLDVSPSGGTARFENDDYFASEPRYQGNPWYVTTLWMAQYYARAGDVNRAKHYIDWAMQHTLPSGVLSEQVNPTDGSQVSVAPLVWSHAELINTILDVTKLN